MSTTLSRVASFFLAPPADAPARPSEDQERDTTNLDLTPSPPSPAHPHPIPPALAVLATDATQAAPAAAALALSTARTTGAKAALVIRWTPTNDAPDPTPFLATPTATRLAKALGETGADAAAAGRLATLTTPARATVLTALEVAISHDAPAVIAVEHPRTTETDEVLADLDGIAIVAAPAAEALAEHARAALGVPATITRITLTRSQRALALAGLTAPPPLRRAAQELAP